MSRCVSAPLRSLGALAVCMVTLVAAPAARADFFSEHANELLSVTNGSPPELAFSATSAVALASGGRYALLTTSDPAFVGAPPKGEQTGQGLVRKDRVTGDVALVARPSRYRPSTNTDPFCGADGAAAGISADGRFVAFVTQEGLVAADANDHRDVYLRDMSKAPGDPGAYRLITARDGTDLPVEYFVDPDLDAYEEPGHCSQNGAVLQGSAAVSDDGNRVVFSINVASDVLDSPTPTPAQNVFVRDVAAKKTMLVTQGAADHEPLPRSSGSYTTFVTLSGDGSTVAWQSEHYGDLQLGPDEYASPPEFGADAAFLWRKLDDGITRRVAPAIDYHDPACTPDMLMSDQTAADSGTLFRDGHFIPESPCLTPFVGGLLAQGISLSTDGQTVAFVAQGDRRGVFKQLGRSDAWLCGMRSGLTRKQGCREITRTVNDGGSNIEAVALAGDASRLIFLSGRTDYSSLTSPMPIGAFSGTTQNSIGLYVVDLRANTLEFATRRGADSLPLHALGAQSVTGTLVPKLSRDGSVAAWSTDAANVFAGDSNDVTDAFMVVPGTPAGGGLVGGGQSPEPGDPDPGDQAVSGDKPTSRARKPASPKASVRASARAGRRGAVSISLRVSGKGKVSVRGTGKVGHKRVVFGTARATAKRSGRVTVTVKPSRSGRRFVGRKVRISFAITFAQTGVRKPATRTVAVTLPARHR